MPLTSAQLTTAANALPTTTVASANGEAGDPVVTVMLKFKGTVTWNPGAFVAALNTLYGAGKVATSEDQLINPLGPLNLDIGP